jgi:AraC-like DNA-binding protein
MEVRDQLIANADFSDQIEIGCLAAEDIFRFKTTAPFEFTSKVDNWLSEPGYPDVDLLTDSTGLSLRQLERMTKRYYGMPPKKLARKYRALRAAQALAHGDSLDDAGLGLAFYDQSHLIREVKQFTGLTPSQLRAGKSQLTRATMEGRRALGGKVGSLISDS